MFKVSPEVLVPPKKVKILYSMERFFLLSKNLFLSLSCVQLLLLAFWSLMECSQLSPPLHSMLPISCLCSRCSPTWPAPSVLLPIWILTSHEDLSLPLFPPGTCPVPVQHHNYWEHQELCCALALHYLLVVSTSVKGGTPRGRHVLHRGFYAGT